MKLKISPSILLQPMVDRIRKREECIRSFLVYFNIESATEFSTFNGIAPKSENGKLVGIEPIHLIQRSSNLTLSDIKRNLHLEEDPNSCKLSITWKEN